MISVPQPKIRSIRPCSNRTLLMRPSGMSIPVRLITPSRAITRSVVTMKCVVRQRMNGTKNSHTTMISATAPMAISPIVLQLVSWTSRASQIPIPTVAMRIR